MLAMEQAKKRQKFLRDCPNCGSQQNAAKKKIDEPISCPKCGTEIPPTTVESEEDTGNKE